MSQTSLFVVIDAMKRGQRGRGKALGEGVGELAREGGVDHRVWAGGRPRVGMAMRVGERTQGSVGEKKTWGLGKRS